MNDYHIEASGIRRVERVELQDDEIAEFAELEANNASAPVSVFEADSGELVGHYSPTDAEDGRPSFLIHRLRVQTGRARQTDLADLLGVTQATISRWDSDELAMSKPVRKLIARIFGED